MTTPTTTANSPDPTTARPAAPRTSRARTAVIAAVGVLAGAGIAAGLVLGLGSGSTQQPATPAPVPGRRSPRPPPTDLGAARTT